MGEFAEADARHACLADVAARAAVDGVAVADARRARVAGQCLQVALRLCALFGCCGSVDDGPLECRTSFGEAGKGLTTLLVADDLGLVVHQRSSRNSV